MSNQTGKKNRILLSQRNLWAGGLIKERENRYRENFSRKSRYNKNTKEGEELPGYINKYTKEEAERKIREHDDAELKVDFFWSKETGPLSNILGKPPIRTLIDNERLATASRFKKFLYVFLQEMEYSTWYEKLGILLSIRKLRNIYLESVYRGISEYLIDLDYITPPVREMRRVLEKVFPGDGKYEWEGYYSDPPCFFLEYDVAYRYPAQDILSCVKKEECIKQGGKVMSVIRLILWFITKKDRVLYRATREGKRLVDTLVGRQAEEGWKWGKLSIMVTIVLQGSPKLRNKFVDFIQEIDIEKIRLNQFDRYWAYTNKEYNCEGLPYQLRNEINKDYGQVK